MNLRQAKEYLQACCQAGLFDPKDIELLDDIELLVFAKREADRAEALFDEWLRETTYE